ncbi:MAG: cation transporter, partial [Patescibacteria group bacterium]
MAENKSNSVDLSLSGMHCASCAKLIESAVGKLPGVSEARVNFAAEKGRVKYDETKVGVPEILAEVKRAGYSA